MTERLDWTEHGRDWPNRDASRFVTAGSIRWHVQVLGSGPVVLMLHGTGSSTHSWRRLAPLLAKNFTVVAPDLPGHAFTGTPGALGLTLPGMAGLVTELINKLGHSPEIAVGHSAGAAVLLRMCLDGAISPRRIVSINGALMPMGGFAGSIFSPLAKMLVLNPFAPRLFAWRAQSREAVRRLLEGTGSKVDDVDLDYYARLFRCISHVAGTLTMMAGWDLEPLQRDMGDLMAPLLLLAATNDKAIPPEDAEAVRRKVATADVRRLEGLGHLAHEENPELLAEILSQAPASTNR
jgi:magnesium chelatase accessory protein